MNKIKQELYESNNWDKKVPKLDLKKVKKDSDSSSNGKDKKAYKQYVKYLENEG